MAYGRSDKKTSKEDKKGKKGKKMNEVSGWKLEDEDLTLVNSESDGDKLYIVKLWWGSGYMTDNYNAWAFSEEEALNYVVAYLEKNDPELLATTDERANEFAEELEQEHASKTGMGYDDDFYPEDTPEFQETFLWVDATMEGAKKAHYIWAENLQIAEYPKDHDYPMAKGARHMNESYDDKWQTVTAGYDEFVQRLWGYTRKDMKNRRDAFSRCTNSMEKALREYYNEVVYDGED